MELDGIIIPEGNSKEEVMARDKAIMDFYARWNAEHPQKCLWNEDLQDYINVRFLSMQETAEKAARQFRSTLAVFRLSELLTKSRKVGQVPVKKRTRNQQRFCSMLIMQLDDVKMTVGVLKSGSKIQYCITSLK